MSDQIKKAYPLMSLMVAALSASHDSMFEMMALCRIGHPRAQSFDPSGHGGSDPTLIAGILPDKAVADGREYMRLAEATFRNLRRMGDIASDYEQAVRPEAMPADYNAVLAEHGCSLHAQAVSDYRQRGEGMGSLCRPCYERQQWQRKHHFGDLTLEQVRYYEANKGRWPKMHEHDAKPAVDVVRIAGAARLGLGATALSAEQAATIIQTNA